MGRTNPTFRDRLRQIEDQWTDFRRALRRQDKPRFDRLFEYARSYADAAGYLNYRRTLTPVLLSVDLGQEQRIEELETRIEELEDAISPSTEEGTDAVQD